MSSERFEDVVPDSKRGCVLTRTKHGWNKVWRFGNDQIK